MFEKEAEDNKPPYAFCSFNTKCELWKSGFQQGAEFGYNKGLAEGRKELEEKISVLLSCKNCPENKVCFQFSNATCLFNSDYRNRAEEFIGEKLSLGKKLNFQRRLKMTKGELKPIDTSKYKITETGQVLKMTKDEMKNRISMALKDPVLQQGFEIICKENAELKSKNCWKTCEYAEPKSQWISQHIQDVGQLTQAKEIIKNLIDSLTTIDGEQVRELREVKEAEQFLIADKI